MKDYKRKLLKTIRAQMEKAETIEELNGILFGALKRSKQKEFDNKLVVHHAEATPVVQTRVAAAVAAAKAAELAAYYAWLNSQPKPHKGEPYDLHHQPVTHPRQPSNTLESFYMEPWKWNATSAHPYSQHGGGS